MVLRNRVLGKEHKNTIQSMHNFAISLSDVGRSNEALYYKKKVK